MCVVQKEPKGTSSRLKKQYFCFDMAMKNPCWSGQSLDTPGGQSCTGINKEREDEGERSKNNDWTQGCRLVEIILHSWRLEVSHRNRVRALPTMQTNYTCIPSLML